MSNPILALQLALREFMEDPDHTVLVLRGSAQDIAVAAKLLVAEDRQSEERFHLNFVQACEDAPAYVDEIATNVDAQIEAANQARDDAALPRWPALPLEVGDQRRAPAPRIEDLVAHCERIVPAGHEIVWAFLPAPLTDHEGYKALVQPLLEPIERHHFILCDDAHDGTLVDDLARQGRDDVLVLDVDLSKERFFDGLAAVARDPLAPREERLEALFELTQADLAHGRHAAALRKYEALFDAYDGVDPVRQACCLCGASGVALMLGDASLALAHAQSGIVVALETGSLVVLSALMTVAGQACMQLGKYADAAGYFDYANGIAAKRFDPFAKADALERRGDAELADDRPADARKTWETCTSFCEEFRYEVRWKSAMTRLSTLFEKAGMDAQHDKVQAQILIGMPEAASA